MLETFRKNKSNLVFSLLILLIVAVMAMYGVGQMSNEGQSGGVAAWVNSEAITKQEYGQELEYKMNQYRGMLGGQFDEKLLLQFQVPQRTLDEMVSMRLLTQNAKDLGFRVSDSELADHIRAMPYFQKDGKFDAQLYARLPNRGLEEKRQRDRLVLIRMQTYLVERVNPTPLQVRRAFEMRETKVDLQYAAIDLENWAKDQKPTATDLAAFTKSTPEGELQAYYETNKKTFTEAGTAHFRQIRVGLPFQANEAQRQEAKKKIEKIKSETQEKNFAEMAIKYSDDPYAKKGGDAGTVKRGTLEAALEKELDILEPGKVSSVVDTPYGFYLLQLIDKKEATTKPYALVKGQIAEQMYKERKKADITSTKLAELEKKLSSGGSIEPELKSLKAELKKTGPFSLGQGYIPNLGNAEPVLDAVFELSEKQPVIKKLIKHQNQYYFIKLAKVERPKEESFTKDSESLEKGYSTTIQGEIMGQWVDALKKKATIKTMMKFDAPVPMEG